MKKQIAGAALKYAGKKAAQNIKAKGLKAYRSALKVLERFAKENPGYDHAGASFDLFGGESRRLPKKVSEFHRPRVRVRGGTMTLAEGSPFKGRVVKLNPAPRVVVKPLRVTLTAAEVRSHKSDPAKFVAQLMKKAATVSGEWDHIEARGPGGRHLFDVVP